MSFGLVLVAEGQVRTGGEDEGLQEEGGGGGEGGGGDLDRLRDRLKGEDEGRGRVGVEGEES